MKPRRIHCRTCFRRHATSASLLRHLMTHPTHRTNSNTVTCCGHVFSVESDEGLTTLSLHVAAVKPRHNTTLPSSTTAEQATERINLTCCGYMWKTPQELLHHVCHDDPRHSVPTKHLVRHYNERYAETAELGVSIIADDLV